MLTWGGVYRIVRPALGGTLAKLMVIFVYSLLCTSLVSLFAYALMPDGVRPSLVGCSYGIVAGQVEEQRSKKGAQWSSKETCRAAVERWCS